MTFSSLPYWDEKRKPTTTDELVKVHQQNIIGGIMSKKELNNFIKTFDEGSNKIIFGYGAKKLLYDIVQFIGGVSQISESRDASLDLFASIRADCEKSVRDS
jgi:hypothetical protein